VKTPNMLYLVDTGFFLESLKPRPLFPDEGWLQRARGESLCPQCDCIARSRYPKPIDVVLCKPPHKQTSALVETTGITIWRRDFLDLLSEYMEGFALGRCLLADGRVLGRYATCYGPNYIVIRGNRQSRYHICPGCGTVSSHVKPGPEYILTCYLTDAKVYQDSQCRLFLTEDIAWGLDFEPWEDVSCEPVSVREIPADGQHLPGGP